MCQPQTAKRANIHIVDKKEGQALQLVSKLAQRECRRINALPALQMLSEDKLEAHWYNSTRGTC